MKVNRFIVIMISIISFFAITGSAQAFDWSIKLEPGLAGAVTRPQSDLFHVGGDLEIKALFGINRYVDLGPALGFVGLPASKANPNSDVGVGWQIGPSLRIKRPHDVGVISPWVDTDLLYVKTGPLDRFGFSVGAGLSAPVDSKRKVWVGPFVRYLQIVQPNHAGYDDSDAKIVIAGLSLEAGSKHPLPFVRPEVVYVNRPIVTTITKTVIVNVPVKEKCPTYENVDVGATKIVLKHPIHFAWDSFVLAPAAYPILDDVVSVMNDKTLNVRIEGHASLEGSVEHNQVLSENRAKAVLEYLVAHGVDRSRLTSKGFGSSVPVESNKTSSGREANRRVEFIIDLVITNGGGTK